MDPTPFKTAYEDPATRRAFRRTVMFRTGVALLSLVLHVIWLYANVVFLTPVWLWITFPLWLVILYVSMAAVGRLLTVKGLRPVLKVYPWQRLENAVAIAKNGTVRISVPNPDQPEKQVSLKEGNWLGSGYTYWVRAAKADAVGEIWFAGDPRFVGVAAVPGPGRLIVVSQPEAFNGRTSARKRGVSPEARERARAAGARVG
ncbi:hypothetical protein ACH429_05155 [Streptomyces pathocidini]|uniref:Bacterial Pleckstrin homology domain-containing protein n=1 Tax=Streptomyces pathocidini TaxID=1650571 RepID=A0ABW7ULI6_9ACTN|nr:hypothetical protein [Streptomyces pathocidini]